MARKTLDCNLHVVSFLNNKPKGEYDEYPPAGSLDLPEGKYEFHYDYPLSTKAVFKRKLKSKTSGRNILRYAAKDYKKIYDIEDGKVGNPGNIPGMLNRASSNGPFGIWGHDIGDLYFEGIYIDLDKKVITFGMGS
jgi:hypothetical protein